MKRSFPTLLSLFLLTTTVVTAQTTRTRNDANLRAGYASSVAVVGGALLVGEPANTLTPGIVYLYDKDADGEWVETTRLTASDAVEGDRFGSAIASSGDILLISATERADGQGAVYVFGRSPDGTWTEQHILSAPSDSAGSGFGRSLAVGPGAVFVGAPDRNEGTGAVYTFSRKDDGSWGSPTLIEAERGEGNDLFGTSMAVSGGSLIVGAPGRDSREGVAYVFVREENEWREETSLSAFGIERNSRFGFSMAADGESLVIGAARHQRSTGAAFTYAFEDGEWNQTGMLVPFDASPNTRFGTAVAFVDGDIWVGAPGADGFSGAIYSNERNGGTTWTRATKLAASDGVGQTMFGTAMAVEHDVALVGRPGADSGTGTALVFEKVDGVWTETAILMGDVEAIESVAGNRVACENGKAGRFPCESVDMISFMSIKDLGGGRGVNLNDIWGWTDPATGKEWALVGRTNGTSFVDVSNPSQPIYVGNLPLHEGAHPAAWRDIKVYRDHAFIVSDGAGSHGMQVFDLSRLRSVDDPPRVFDEDAHYDGVHSVHNIVINEETGFAYAVGSNSGGETCGGGLHMINIQDPQHPTFAGCFADSQTGRSGTGYSHDAMCIVYHGPDADYQGHEICFGANETALSIADVSDKDTPVAVSSASYPNVGYSHQGWISEDHRYFYLDDELDELSGRVPSTRTLVWDVADLDDPQLVNEFQSSQKSSDHNLYVRGNYMYQSNYSAGLRVLDISDPVNPVEIGYFDTYPFGENEPGFNGSWSNYPYFESGIIVVTGIGEGLFVLKRQEVDI